MTPEHAFSSNAYARSNAAGVALRVQRGSLRLLVTSLALSLLLPIGCRT